MRLMMEKCAPGGGWAMGTGNSVPEYVPVENFLTMVEEAHILNGSII
jgi:uroporphyrinogen decarboxylase